jgi:hypothetical protein
MTDLLKRAFKEASKLPPGQQDALATALLDELEGERRWDDTLASDPDALDSLADAALAEHRSGRTQQLDPDHL